MARRLRIQFPGAIYHVINRGNYRRDLFADVGAAKSFEDALGDAAVRFEWTVHAYCLMQNHFHVALVTVTPNLGDGMHWLHTTFALRFNRYRSEHGHLFQGRYRSPLVEDASALVRVVNYIYLNPVRAGIVPAERLTDFRWSSLARFVNGSRPEWLSPSMWLGELGMTDRRNDWSRYARDLRVLAGDPAEQTRQGFDTLGRDWAIGSRGWKEALAREYGRRSLEQDLPRGETIALKEQRWLSALGDELRRHGKDKSAPAREARNVGWKVEVALALRKRVGAPYRWIAHALVMGSPLAVRVAVFRLCNM